MKRSPLKRGTTPLRAKTPLRARSAIKRGRFTPKRRARGIPQQTREALRTRAGGRCERCGRSDRRVPCHAHHTQLRSQGGSDDLSNLKYLDAVCHAEVHADRAMARAEGWIIDLGSG